MQSDSRKELSHAGVQLAAQPLALQFDLADGSARFAP